MCVTLFSPEEIFQAASEAAKLGKIEEHYRLMKLYHKMLKRG